MSRHPNSPPRQKETAPRWGSPDRKKFNELVEEGKIDIGDTTPATIKAIRDTYFPERTRERFRVHYRTQAATLITGNLRSGGRGLLTLFAYFPVVVVMILTLPLSHHLLLPSCHR
jgi:hypothetical protein